jgi:hypothetical protein
VHVVHRERLYTVCHVCMLISLVVAGAWTQPSDTMTYAMLVICALVLFNSCKNTLQYKKSITVYDCNVSCLYWS